MSNTTRDYRKDFDYRAFAHTASASQFESFLTCPRKWWFQKVVRLPELWGQRKFEFGDRLHEACERYLQADTSERVDGEPVDLFPPGWNEGLSDFDSSLVKRLVEKGVEEGVLRLTPGRTIEAPVGIWNGHNYTPRQIVPGVGVCGYRDVAAPGLVEDHKSIKNRHWAKSQADLLADPQLLLYAGVDLLEHYEAGKPIPDYVTLRHNQFIKDPNDLHVKAVEVEVDRETVQEFWEQTLEPAAAEMLRYKRELRDGSRWPEVEGPRRKGACQEYGGCPFAKICGKVETPTEYRSRIERINAMPVDEVEPILNPAQEGNNAMGIFDRLNKSNKPEAQAEPAPNTPTQDTTAVAEAPSEPEDVLDVAPWANPKCKACKGLGFNSKGAPCAACDRVAARNEQPRSFTYVLQADEAGVTTITRKSDAAVVARVQLQSPEVKSSEKTRPPSKSTQEKGAAKRGRLSKPQADKAPAKDAEPPAALAAEPADVKPTAGKNAVTGRKRGSGFTIVYGSVRRTTSKLLDLNELFSRYAAELAEAHGADSFYQLDRFKRRDQMAAKAGAIAETIKPATLVVVRADDPDVRSFVTALEPFASNIIEGLS